MLDPDESTWQRVTFGEVVKNANAKSTDPVSDGIDRVIAMEHLDPGDLAITRWGSLDTGTTFTRRVVPGQTLFGKRRAYQRKVAYSEFDAICSGDILTFEAVPGKLLPELLPFIVQSDPFFERAVGTSAGSLSPRTNWRDLAKFEFDLPPLDEQKRIADLLWAVENHTRATQALNLAADDTLNAIRNSRFSAIEAPEVQFSSICLIPSQNGIALKKSDRAGDCPMVNMGEMFNGEAISTSAKYERVRCPSDKFLLNKGDLLFARRSIVFEGAGNCCIVPEIAEPMTFESSIMRVRVDSQLSDPEYLLHYFRSSRGRTAISKIVRRGPVSGISGSDLRKVTVPLPSLEVQRDIATSVERLAQPSEYVKKCETASMKLCTSLLSSIFGGA